MSYVQLSLGKSSHHPGRLLLLRLYEALDILWHNVAGAIFQVLHKYVCTSDLTANVSRERDLASELLYFTQLQRMPDCIHNCSREPGVTATKT